MPYRIPFVSRGYGSYAFRRLNHSYTISFSSPLKVHHTRENQYWYCNMEATKEYLSVYSGANGNNDVWFNQLRNSVLAIGALDLTEENYVVPDPNGTSAAAVARFESHNKKSQQFRAVVSRACGTELGNHIIGDLVNPREIWLRILEFRDSTRENNTVVIRQQLYSDRMGSGSAQQFVNRVMSHRRNILRCGGNVSDEEMIAVLLAGLPHTNVSDDFHALVSETKRNLRIDPINTNLAHVVNKILSRDAEVQTLREINGEAAPAQAMINISNRGQRITPISARFRNSRAPPRSQWGVQNTGNCWFCDVPGHYKDSCPEFFEYLMRNLRSHHLYRPQGRQQLNVANSVVPPQILPPSSSAPNPLTSTVPPNVEPLSNVESEEEFLQMLDAQNQSENPSVSLNALHIEDHPSQGW